jgi:hypothetical protein
MSGLRSSHDRSERPEADFSVACAICPKAAMFHTRRSLAVVGWLEVCPKCDIVLQFNAIHID